MRVAAVFSPTLHLTKDTPPAILFYGTNDRLLGQGEEWGDDMNLTNDSYDILISTKNFTERYYRDKDGWLKVSARGRVFRMTAEQVLNHVLPALAGIKPNLSVRVEHHKRRPRTHRTTI